MNLAGGQMSGARNVAECGQCRFRHREGSKPVDVSRVHGAGASLTYSHGAMQRARDFIVGFETRAAAQDFRQPELSDSPSHVLDLALGR